MSPQEVFDTLVQQFGDSVITKLHTDAIDPWIEVSAGSITEVAAFLKTDSRLRFDHLNDLTGVDYCEPDEKKVKKFGHDPHVEVVYHLSSYTHKHAVVVKVILPRWKNDTPGQIPEIPTVSSVWAIADWHERECFDLVGVNFVGHPNLRRILCAEDWVGHALRKDYEFPLEYHGIRGK